MPVGLRNVQWIFQLFAGSERACFQFFSSYFICEMVHSSLFVSPRVQLVPPPIKLVSPPIQLVSPAQFFFASSAELIVLGCNVFCVSADLKFIIIVVLD
jgi:hypothetical protein